MRHIQKFVLENPLAFKENIIKVLRNTKHLCLLNSNGYGNDRYSKYDFLLGIGAVDKIRLDMKDASKKEDAFSSVRSFHHKKQDWLFGHWSYDLKNQLEHLSSDNPDNIQAPVMHFFQPEMVMALEGNQLLVMSLENGDDTGKIRDIIDKSTNDFPNLENEAGKIGQIFPKISKTEYINTIKKIKEHIQRGDIYEMNFCQEFFSKNTTMDPFSAYNKLVRVSPVPFSSFYRIDDVFLLCASPERFLQKTGDTIISQPIKGTIKRGKNSIEDQQLITQLKNSEKDQGENVMIVDLVRNDLSKISTKGSVNVEELFGINTYKQVHHMVSTIQCQLRKELHFTDVLRNTFPMGSMTGAPKIRAMQLIEEYEKTQRGIYSGSVGYITPKGDFDFNVIIRSMIYNKKKKYLSYMVGGAITDGSVPMNEYDECLVKAKAIEMVLKDLSK